MNKRKPTRYELERKIIDLEAQLAHRYKYAPQELDKAGEPLMASAAVLQITALGGRSIVAPVAILNGLSTTTIEALKADIARSFELVIGLPKK